MTDFDKLRRQLAATMHKGECKKARVLSAKLLLQAKTPAQRNDVHRAQQRVARCTTNLGRSLGIARSAPRQKSFWKRLFG